MKVTAIRSDVVYQKIAEADMDKKDDIYRYELMSNFAHRWECYNVPMKAKKPGGYDVIMASAMLGYLEPTKIDASKTDDIKALSEEQLWKTCTQSIEKPLKVFLDAGVILPVEEYRYTILLPNPDSIYAKLDEGCCGEGGIPGTIFLALQPTEKTVKKIPAVLAHECNHNVRFQFVKWSNHITLEEMMINEGLAENYATWMYGEEMLGPWVTQTDMDTLNGYIKPIIKDGLQAEGFEAITAYLYGDDIAKERGYFPQGLPFCAGYACGYHMIKYFLQQTGMSIIEATLLPYDEIKKQIKGFWE